MRMLSSGGVSRRSVLVRLTAHHLRWYEATVNIAETLKGTYKGRLTFAFSTARNEPFRWRNGQAELLLFLRQANGSSTTAGLARRPRRWF